MRRLRQIALLPTLITLGNAVCGFISILKAHEEKYEQAAWFILIAMLFDALDGRVARAMKMTSQFGTQLDSLCDLVTFGIAPAFLVYALCSAEPGTFHYRIIFAVTAFYASCTVIRLARFNVETAPDLKSHMSFSGLPSPAAAGVIAASVIPWTEWPESLSLARILGSALPVATFTLGLLMVSRLRYAHLLNKLFHGYHPFIMLVEVSLVILLLVLFHEFAIFAGFLGYALFGPIQWLRTRAVRKPSPLTESGYPQEPNEPLF